MYARVPSIDRNDFLTSKARHCRHVCKVGINFRQCSSLIKIRTYIFCIITVSYQECREALRSRVKHVFHGQVLDLVLVKVVHGQSCYINPQRILVTMTGP